MHTGTIALNIVQSARERSFVCHRELSCTCNYAVESEADRCLFLQMNCARHSQVGITLALAAAHPASGDRLRVNQLQYCYFALHLRE